MMTFRKVSFRQNPVGSGLVDEFALDRVTGELKKVGETDIQQVIDSCLSSSLDVILDKFLNDEVVNVDPLPADVMMDTSVLDDALEAYGAAVDRLEAVRDTYDLPIDWDAKKINAYMAERKQKCADLAKLKESLAVDGPASTNAPSAVE